MQKRERCEARDQHGNRCVRHAGHEGQPHRAFGHDF